MVPTGETLFKAYPPIRRKFQQEGLWDGVNDNNLMVSSGHMPIDPVLKDERTGDFYRSMSGINSMQYFLPAFFTEATKRIKKKSQKASSAGGEHERRAKRRFFAPFFIVFEVYLVPAQLTV